MSAITAVTGRGRCGVTAADHHMHALNLFRDPQAPAQVLCLGAHCDDIEIGCGATILTLLDRYPQLSVDWVIFTSDAERDAEARASAAAFLRSAAVNNVIVHAFRTSFLPYDGAKVKEAFESLKTLKHPDVIFTHQRNDLHQDHRIVNELTWNTFRDHLILEYEIPKFDGDLGQPAVFMPVSEHAIERKIELVHAHFPSQRSKPWFTADLFRAMARLRGMECNAKDGFAEAFFVRKLRVA